MIQASPAEPPHIGCGRVGETAGLHVYLDLKIGAMNAVSDALDKHCIVRYDALLVMMEPINRYLHACTAL